MLMKTSPTLDVLTRPQPTDRHKIDRWRQRTGGKVERVSPGIDVGALSRKYGGNPHAPRWRTATFRVPVGMSEDIYLREKAHQVYRWLQAEEKKGWDWQRNTPIKAAPHIYPARDLASGIALLDQYEFTVTALFVHRTAKPDRIEIDPEWLKPTT